MLKLSNRGLYGIKALYELAMNYGKEPLNIRVISQRHSMPMPFLEQVLNRLKRGGLVDSLRGVRGGYFLSRHPGEITMGDAIRALEGPIALCNCLIDKTSKSSQRMIEACVTSGIYTILSTKLEEAFDSVTLLDLTEGPPPHVVTLPCKQEKKR
jgi:Rrf2 family transcriptional regulator, cysteine metabolism repressor